MLNESIFHYDSFALFDSTNIDSDESNVNYASSSIIEMFIHVYRLCNVKFYFNNKLHRHLFVCRKKHKKQITVELMKNFHEQFIDVSIIEFTTKHENDANYQFRK